MTRIRPDIDPDVLKKLMEYTGETDKNRAITKAVEEFIRWEKAKAQRVGQQKRRPKKITPKE